MSIKDYDKVINIYNGTTGTLITSFDYLDLIEDGNQDLLQFSSLENISFNKILRKCLENKDDIQITIGYKG